MSQDESEEGVTVATFANSFEAEIACGALHAAGIPAEIPLESDHLKGPMIGGNFVEIRVLPRDRDEALKILHAAGHK